MCVGRLSVEGLREAALYKLQNAEGIETVDFWSCFEAVREDGLLLVMDVS